MLSFILSVLWFGCSNTFIFISLSSAMEIGDELHIVVYNSSASAVTQVLPNTGAFVSMSNSYISIPASRYVEINIICHATGSYIIRAGGVS